MAVQTAWMKSAVCRRFSYPEALVSVVPPSVKILTGGRFVESLQDCTALFELFYPAVPFEYKNHLVLLSALAHLKEKFPDVFSKVRLKITAEPEQTSYSRKIVQLGDQLGVLSAISWLGTISREDCFSAYANSVALVFPSMIETVGLPLVEAAFCGCPIVVADLPYAREVLAKYPGVLFVNPSKPEDWAEAICSVVREPRRFDSMQSYTDGWKGFVLELENLARGAC